MKVRPLKRVMCFILTFLLVIDSVGPTSVLPDIWASALAHAQEAVTLLATSNPTSSSKQIETNDTVVLTRTQSTEKTDGETIEAKSAVLRTVYFQPNETWTEGESRYAAVAATAEGEIWIDGTDEEKDGRIEFQIPEDATKFRFVRLEADQSQNDWEYILNKTEELTLPRDESLNLFTLDEKNTLDEEKPADQSERDGESGKWAKASETPLSTEKESTASTEPRVTSEEKESAAVQKQTPQEQGQATIVEVPQERNATRGTVEPEGTRAGTGMMKLQGKVVFDDDTFQLLLRPLTFNQRLAVVPIYKEDGVETVASFSWPTQEISQYEQCYIQLYPESDGTAEFEISNIPKTVEIDGTTYDVVKYRVIVPTPQPNCYIQEEDTPEAWATSTKDLTASENVNVYLESSLTVVLGLQTCENFQMTSIIVPDEGTEADIQWVFRFTRPDGMNVDALFDEFHESSYIYRDNDNNQTYSRSLDFIPVGLKYEIKQVKANGYILEKGDDIGREVTAEDGTVTEVTWEGTVTAEPMSFTTKNYPLNLRFPFTVNWNDNNNAERRTYCEDPDYLNSIFKLQVRKSGTSEEWVDFPTDSVELLAYDLTSAPTLRFEGNQYYFEGLPGVNKEKDLLEYQVVCTAPENYTADKQSILKTDSDADRTFTLSHCHDFTASIEWKDDSNAENRRPAATPGTYDTGASILQDLKLYSRTIDDSGNITLSEVTDHQWTLSVPESGNTWNITVSGLTTYLENEEIEYFLVHGSDTLSGNTETVTSAIITNNDSSYTPYYENTVGNYANDEQRCHDHGIITMLLSSTEKFSANVVWKDDQQPTTISARPKATLTVWRYTKDGTEQNDGTLDDAFKNNRATMVVYLDENKNEQPLAFELPAGSKDAQLVSDATSVTLTYKDSNGVDHTVTKTVTLPGHDGAGQKYTYFLRETLTGDNKDNYSVAYTKTEESTTTSYAEGAPENGTVTNTRREKALVTVVKTWRNPEGLEGINGASVQLVLKAGKSGEDTKKLLEVYNPDEGSYEILTGASLIQAQTATGFTTSIPTGQQSYYVNIYNDEGLPFDMEQAILEETVTIPGEGGAVTTYAQNGSTITVGSDVYEIKTSYKEDRSTLSGDPKRFYYEQTNTISSKRQYEVEKEWSLSKTLSQTYKENIESVVAQLDRCLVNDLDKDNITWEKVYDYVLVKPNANNTWVTTIENLDKFDPNGNAYYYSASEVGFLLKDVADTSKRPANAVVTPITVDDEDTQRSNFVSASSYNGDADVTWGQSYSRTDDKTTVTNHDAPGSGYFSITKSWKDNNDKDRPASVTIRIYKRGDLYNAVQRKTGPVDWAELDASAIKPVTPTEEGGQEAQSADIVLSKDKGYTVNQTFLSLCNNNEETAQAAKITDYVVLEYKIGDGDQTPVSYTYEEVAALAAPDNVTGSKTSASGTAVYDANGTSTDDAEPAKNRNYSVTVTRNNSRETYYILNKRTGTTELALTKTWNDEHNEAGLRPNSISFQLYRDGELCKDLAGVTFSIKAGVDDNHSVNVSPEQDASNEYTGTFTATCNESIANTAGVWTITISNLPMFEGDTGMLYAYNIDEQNTLAGSSSGTGTESSNGNDEVHYVQTRGAVRSGSADGVHQQFSIDLENTVVGLKTHTAYKYWKDASVTDKNLRPELNLTLYRYIKSAAANIGVPANATYYDLVELENGWTEEQKNAVNFEEVTSHNDPVLTPNNEAGDKENGASGQPYDWKITIDELPRFDSTGREYVYVLKEEMTNSGETVLGTYVGKTERHEKNAGDGVWCDEFTNTITGNLALSGVKTWKGHESYEIEKEELPDPKITLYRTTDDTLSNKADLSSESEETIQSYITEGKINEVDEIILTGNNKNSYAFPSAAKIQAAATSESVPYSMVLDGETLKLRKYDENGKRITYLMRETLPSTGGIVDQLYAKTSATGMLVNTLKSGVNRRKITVHKIWANRHPDQQENTYDPNHKDKFPSITFELYRKLTNSDAWPEKPYKSKTIEAKNATETKTYTATFDDLLVYSPKGQLYQYYVTEVPINGYHTTISTDSTFDDSCTITDMSNASNLAFNDTEGWNTESGITNNLYVKNTYAPNDWQIKLKGGKVWDDWHDEAQLRPESIDVELKRYTNAEPGQENDIKEYEINLMHWTGEDAEPNVPWIKWVKTGVQDSYGRDKWTYEIGGLPKYAPNGRQYIYTLSEKRNNLDGYADAGKVRTSEDDSATEINLNDLTNSLTASCKFRKYWQDGSDFIGLRPKSITVVLQYATKSVTEGQDGNTIETWSDWQDVPYTSKYVLTKDGSPYGVSKDWQSYVGSSHSGALSVVLTTDKAVPNTGGNVWDYTFENLPGVRNMGTSQAPDLKEVKYRCLEAKIGNVEVDERNKASSYIVSYRKNDDNATEATNALDSVKLKVTKVWDDSNNEYESRPTELTFKLQRKATNAGEGHTLSRWIDVMDPKNDSVPYQFKLTDANKVEGEVNKWEYTVENLPIAGTDSDGLEFFNMEYRAVEVHDSEKPTAASGAKNYVDINANSNGGYDDANDGHTFNTQLVDDVENTSTITNKLTTLTTDIIATKVWYASDNKDDDGVEATFELQYKVKGATEWNSYSTPLTKTLKKKTNGTTQNVTWTGLPQYDLEGNELEYQIIEHEIQGYTTEFNYSPSTGSGSGDAGYQEDDFFDDDDSAGDAGAGSGSSTGGDGLLPSILPDVGGSGSGSGTRSESNGDGTGTYAFTNIELQDYTVNKTWNKPGADNNGVSYIPDNNGSFTSTYVLKQKVGDGEWTDCTPPVASESASQTLTGDTSYTWHKLPKYTDSGEQITYRAVETHINGNAVANDTDGNYIVTYDYDPTTEGTRNTPAFDDTRTNATNRLVYGFVDLSKEAAYLAPAVTDLNTDLSGIEFKIQRKDGENYKDYVTGIVTDSNGNLTRHPDGTYGTQYRYLIPGSYKLDEVSTHSDYSLWDRGVEFNVGLTGGDTDTGEHGTAWISTTNALSGGLQLSVSYIYSNASSHSFGDTCAPATENTDAYNLESRGVLSFTKTGSSGALDTHTGSNGEAPAYFGVYTDSGCTTQVAGMSAGLDGKSFSLTDKWPDGITQLIMRTNAAGIPYLRSYGTGFTLLSGTYYVKELVPPAGYKLDTTPRQVTVDKLTTTAIGTDLSSVYSNNVGKFATITNGTYSWPNTPNSVTIYKMDQFGRKVTLKDNGWLELKFDGTNNTFPTGENTIRLYQNANKPATKIDGGTRVGNESGKWSITYDDSKNAWIITGLFDAGKSYTLSEPSNAVPDHNIQAKDITFSINAAGELSDVTGADSTTAQDSDVTLPLNNHGDNYTNLYHSDATANQILVRDVARFRKNVVLKKQNYTTSSPISNIAFELYAYTTDPNDSSDAHLVITNQAKDALVTDSNGEINLLTKTNLANSLTGNALSNGLDIGKYFFQELEYGASDGYRLVGKVFFEIKTVDNPNVTNPQPEDYAEVVFDTSNTLVSQESGTDVGTVRNTPVSGKSLNLTKKDEDGTTLLSGARFRLDYVSITDGEPGSKTSGSTPITTYAMTDDSGALKTATVSNGTWTIGTTAPDISAKGTYTLTELQAPSAHSTYTTSGTTETPPMLKFLVDSDNEIKYVGNTSGYILDAFTGSNGGAGLVDTPTISTGAEGDMTVTVMNNKTSVTIDKLNDLYNNTKTRNQHNLTGESLTGAVLKIYEGVGTSGTLVQTLDGTSVSSWTLTGVLSENTVYTLHEETAPVGFLEADDIYFCLFGTRSTGTATESQLYVWTGTTAPTGSTVTPEALTATGSPWSQTQNLDSNNDLTMVDEAIIAPVDARKVLKTGDGESASYAALPGATFDVHVDGNGGAKLGTVVTGSDGYLTWQSIETSALDLGLIYNSTNSSNKRITDALDALNQTVILRQNSTGYTFTETYAPDNAYNEGIGESKVYHVAIADQNYKDYKAHSDYVIDLVAANANTPDHTATLAAKQTTAASASDLLNPAYKSTVTLHKYDSDPEGNSAAIAGAEFTLTRQGDTQPYAKASMGGTVQTTGKFTTDASGNLSITIPEKGTYTLTETKAATGYKLDANNTFTFTLVDKTDGTTPNQFGYNATNDLKKAGDTTGVPNARQYGVITLTKTDKDSNVKLDGVVYTLDRTDKPSGITQYFSVASQTVTTGKSYNASYDSANQRWTLTEAARETGKITISGLDWGNYTLTETTETSGYALDMTNDAQRTAHTKTYTIASNTTSQSEVLKPTAQTDTNTKNSVTFHKTDNTYDGTNTKDLSGAVFEVHDASNQKVEFFASVNATTKVSSITSGTDGKVTIYGLPTDPNSDAATTYKLVEVTAPAGYVLNPTPVEFSIDRKGNVKVNNDAVTEVPMVNKPIFVTLKKLGETGIETLNGAEFTLTPNTGSRFVDNVASKSLTVTSGEPLIPIETLIGGCSYTLTETKAPDGYEATAVVNFTVATDGQVTVTSTSGGYVASSETMCASASNTLQTGSTGEYESTLSIRDEQIRVTLTKVDSNAPTTTLSGVAYKLTPYGDGSKFTPGFTYEGLSGDEFTATTNASGVIDIPDGLLVHGCSYLLQETSIPDGLRYYLGHEAKDGVILNVAQNGSITVERLTSYQGKTAGGVNSCPVSADNSGGNVALTAKNPKAAVFKFTKSVSGNMGDLTGNFKITMEVYEPDGTLVDTKVVTLKNGEGYSSEYGKLDKNGTTVLDDTCAFGTNAIPVGALLKIKEEPAQDYEPVVASLANAETVSENIRGEVWLRLTQDYTKPATFTLTNNKQVAIDVGVPLERNAPYAAIAMLIPAAWLYLRAKRRRRDGDNE